MMKNMNRSPLSNINKDFYMCVCVYIYDTKSFINVNASKNERKEGGFLIII